MFKNGIVRLAVLAALVLSSRSALAQSGSVSGLYRITAGTFSECCGITGNDVRVSLPNATQAYVQLTVDTEKNLATMTFLGGDRQTVFSVVPCPLGDPIAFNFSYGLVFSDHVVFHVDPGPPPYGLYWNYTVSNSTSSLRLEGTLGTAQSLCVDVPNRFNHSNVVATLVPVGPAIKDFQREGALVRFRFTGVPPNDFFVEFSDALPATNWLSLTNYRAKLQPIEAVAYDSLTNAPARFYRIRQQDCQCD